MNHENRRFIEFDHEYKLALENYLHDNKEVESHLAIGYQLGRDSIANDLGILSVVAIHHNALIEFIENIKSNEFAEITDKASIFLEEVLAPYQMVAKGFRESITLINKNIINFSNRIQALQESENQFKVLTTKLETSLSEKESLLKEIYHRVKNNLQVITSLLNLQVEAIQEENAKNLLIECSNRVRSMALIHEMLYQTRNLEKIDMEAYVDSLSKYLIEAYCIDTTKIKLITQIQSFSLSIDYAIPCGIIINELLTNSLKHAFPTNEQGIINLTLTKINKTIELVIKDNGKGLPINFDVEKTNTLGMRLIKNLSKQVNGNLEIVNGTGTIISLSFEATN